MGVALLAVYPRGLYITKSAYAQVGCHTRSSGGVMDFAGLREKLVCVQWNTANRDASCQGVGIVVSKILRLVNLCLAVCLAKMELVSSETS